MDRCGVDFALRKEGVVDERAGSIDGDAVLPEADLRFQVGAEHDLLAHDGLPIRDALYDFLSVGWSPYIAADAAQVAA